MPVYHFDVIVSTLDGCIDTSAIYEVNNVDILAPDRLSSLINIYPNPTSEWVFIEAPMSVDLVLCSIEGKTLRYLTAANQITLSDVVEGIYLLKVYDRQGRLIKTEKIIKSL